jgi:DNA-binding protein Fis
MSKHSQKVRYAIQNEDGSTIRKGFRTFLEVEQTIQSDSENTAPQMIQNINIETVLTEAQRIQSLNDAFSCILEILGNTGVNLPELVSRILIKTALDKCDGVQMNAAKMLGISRRVMCHWAKQKGCATIELDSLPVNNPKLLLEGDN